MSGTTRNCIYCGDPFTPHPKEPKSNPRRYCFKKSCKKLMLAEKSLREMFRQHRLKEEGGNGNGKPNAEFKSCLKCGEIFVRTETHRFVCPECHRGNTEISDLFTEAALMVGRPTHWEVVQEIATQFDPYGGKYEDG